MSSCSSSIARGCAITASSWPPGGLGINGSVTVPDSQTLPQLRNLSQPDPVRHCAGIYYRLLKTDGSARRWPIRSCGQTDGTAAQARFGERVPIPVTQFAKIGTGTLPQQPITSFNYQNIGVNIDIRRGLHNDDAVSLTVKLEVKQHSGTGFGDLRHSATRDQHGHRLRDGETNMLAGLDPRRRTPLATGIPASSTFR